MKKAGKQHPSRSLLDRYRSLPRDLRSPKLSEKNRAQKLLALTICLPLMIWALGSICSWELTRRRIEQDNAAFSALYTQASPAPTVLSPTAIVTEAPAAEASAPSVSEAPSIAPSPTPTSAPTPSAAPAPTEAPAVQTAAPTDPPMEIAVDATIAPRATANADTIVYAMETPPPVQPAFGDLLSLNPHTVGFLQLGSDISLPVVQKPNDNDYYLNHSFNCEESIGGTLFLDGSNLLVPEDPALIIYGHNMRNGTMFRPLIQYESIDYLKSNPLVQFDTIYENRCYAPFAVFTVAADADRGHSINIRQFQFDESAWDAYISDMRALSLHSIPVDVAYGDHILLLVTCEYTHNNGRFVVALRQQRENETLDELRVRVLAAH